MTTLISEGEATLKFTPTWTVVHTKARSEELAKRHLAQAGYEAFLPMSRLRPGDPERPHFPRYVFVNVQGMAWAPMFAAVGVDYVLRGADQQAIAIIPTDVIDFLKAEVAAGIVLRKTPKTGERTTVPAGPFAGCEGLVTGQTNHRVKILLDIAIGKAVSVPANAWDGE